MVMRSRTRRIWAGSLVALAMGAAISGPAASEEGPYPKRQPGSWSSTVEIVSVTGKDADKIKAQMTSMFDKLSRVSICFTPDMAANEDPVKTAARNLGTCTYTEKDLTGSTISLSGTCKSNGQVTHLTLKGIVSPTSQDFTISLAGFDDDGPHSLDMKLHSWRNGECTDKDIKVPPPPTI